ncbi:hypothetical protein ACWCRF_00110 [Streptomyces sp. NPDC002405]
MRLGGWFGGAARRRAEELAEAEARITAFGAALDEHDFSPGEPGATDAMRAELGRALDAYEEAKRAFVGDRDREDALDVLRALDDGWHALACLDARRAGLPLPRRLPLCFFDARHGRAVRELPWAPAEGATRNVAVCAACGVRLEERRGGEEGGFPFPGGWGPGPRSGSQGPCGPPPILQRVRGLASERTGRDLDPRGCGCRPWGGPPCWWCGATAPSS